MIGYELTEDQAMYQKTARDFARDVIRPAAPHHDETGEYPWEILKKSWDLGLMNTMIPESAGGLGLGVWTRASSPKRRRGDVRELARPLRLTVWRRRL